MARISDYYQKKQLMEKLASELQQLEEDQSLKTDLEFEKEVGALMEKFDKSPKDVLQIISVMDPSLSQVSGGNEGRAKRAMKTYKNPHTGEVVKTRGGNHKTLKEWREKYGADAVASWKQD